MSVLGEAFVQRALLAGGAVGLLAGLVGWFLVQREQVFAADALTHVAYAGSLGALALGLDARFGLFTASVAVGLGLSLLGGRRAVDDTAIGTVFAFVLGLGVLFLSLFTRRHSTGNSTANVNALFGSLFGLSASTALTAGVLAVVLVAVLLVIARPLLLATLDPLVATARGVPARALGAGWLALLGATAAEASQVVGALLLLGLLAAPAATAGRLTASPWAGLALSGLLGLIDVAVGVLVSAHVGAAPVSFSITAVAVVAYLLAVGVSRLRAG